MKFSLVLLLSQIFVWPDLLIPLDFRSKSTSLSKTHFCVISSQFKAKKNIKWIYNGKTCSPRTLSPTFVAIKGWSNSSCSGTTVKFALTWLLISATWHFSPLISPSMNLASLTHRISSMRCKTQAKTALPSLHASLALCWAAQRTWTWKGATGAAMKKVSFNFERIFSEILHSPRLFFMRTSPVSVRKLS